MSGCSRLTHICNLSSISVQILFALELCKHLNCAFTVCPGGTNPLWITPAKNSSLLCVVFTLDLFLWIRKYACMSFRTLAYCLRVVLGRPNFVSRNHVIEKILVFTVHPSPFASSIEIIGTNFTKILHIAKSSVMIVWVVLWERFYSIIKRINNFCFTFVTYLLTLNGTTYATQKHVTASWQHPRRPV